MVLGYVIVYILVLEEDSLIS